jgi:membrane protein
VSTVLENVMAENLDLRDDHGNRAEAPQEIPPKGWLDVGKRVKDEARKDNVTLVAAGVAFFGLLAIAPGLAALVSIYGLVSSPADVQRQMESMATAMPPEARTLLTDQLNQVVTTSGSAKGLGVVVGIALALWSASAAMKNLLVALSAMYDEDETRGFVTLRVRALGLTVAGLAFVLVAMGLLALAPAWADSVGNDALSTAISIVRWPLLIVVMMAALAALYRLGPDRDQPRWRWVSWGAVIGTAVWIVASLLFSVYTSNFGNYSKTYGSMAVVVVTMLWLWITSLCVLIGAEVNAELERQTERDSTRGAARPRGQRGAEVADEVAAPQQTR